MLILTRRIGENIRINDDITVTLVSINGNQIRLGIIAPRDCQVHREEIYQKILEENNATSINDCKRFKKNEGEKNE